MMCELCGEQLYREDREPVDQAPVETETLDGKDYQ